MSNELMAVDDETRRLLEAFSSLADNNAPSLPKLIVGHADEDADGTPFVKGEFYIRGDMDTHHKVIKFRPIAAYNQISKEDSSDPDNYKYEGETVLFKMGDIPYGSNGLIGCGRPDSAAIKAMDPTDQQKVRKNFPWKTHLFGVVEGFGDTRLVDFMARGTKAVEIGNFLQEMRKQKKELYTVELELTTTKAKKGATTYWPLVINVLPEKKNVLDIVTEIKQLSEHVAAFNGYIMGKYNHAQHKHTTPQEEEVVQEIITPRKAKTVVYDDLNDEIPF